MMTKKKWTRGEVVRLFEILIENNSPLITDPKFRAMLDRERNLLTNQLTREANGNIAYRSVDVEIDGITDENFWDVIDGTPYKELIEENAAVAIVKMAEKLNILN
jgi:hypothetical protein